MPVTALFELAAGLALLLLGGDRVVRGATALARSLGVSALTVGLVVVGFGTSAPELAVNMLAAWRGAAGLTFGNVVGSNLANIGLIAGAAALLRPIPVRSAVVRREMPGLLFATAAAVILGADAVLDRPPDRYSRGDAAGLLLLFGFFLVYAFRTARQEQLDGAAAIAAAGEPEPRLREHPLRSLGIVVLGLALLVAGGELAVEGAVGLALAFGVSDAVIGLAVVAVGTSLPELAAALVATRRGESDMVLGTVVGSNLFNLLFILGLSALIRPVELPVHGLLDLITMALLTVLLFGVAASEDLRIARLEGLLLLLVYGGYVGWRALAG